MTSQGSPYARFRRALQVGNLNLALAEVSELKQLSPEDGLGLLTLLGRADSASYARQAARWLSRLTEASALSITQVAELACALDDPPGPDEQLLDRVRETMSPLPWAES